MSATDNVENARTVNPRDIGESRLKTKTKKNQKIGRSVTG